MLMRSALFWDITRRRVVIVYRRFGTTYRSLAALRCLYPPLSHPVSTLLAVITRFATPLYFPESTLYAFFPTRTLDP